MSSFQWPPIAGVISINGDNSANQTIVGGTGISVSTSSGTTTITNTGSGGTVNSVGLTAPASILSVSGSPVTNSGTLALSLATQTANTVWAGPATGSAANPTFRALVTADLPSGTGTVTAVTASAPLASSGGATPNITVTGSSLTEATSSVLTITGGSASQLAATTIQVEQATTSTSGYLSSADWNTFNGKQAAGSYITALTGDGTASGPGSVALTLATVNTNTGSFGSSTAIPNFTVNGKGLLTAAGTNVVIAPAGTLSGTTLNATVVTSSLTTVGTIGTGTWQGTQIAVGFGGTGQNSALTQYGVVYGSTTAAMATTAAGTTGQVLTATTSSAPTWAAPITNTYYSGTTATGASWSTSSSTFTDPTNSGGNTLTSVYSNGLTVTAGGSNVPGITFTPSSSAAVYLITATFLMVNQTTTDGCGARLTDGTTAFAWGQNQNTANNYMPFTLCGVYAPGTASAVTVKIQTLAQGGAGPALLISQTTAVPSIQWTVVQIK